MTRTEFEHIAPQLHKKVLKVGLDFFASKEDAEDAAQEAMVLLWRYMEQIDEGRNVEALAVRVAKNCCVSLYRKQKFGTQVSHMQLTSSETPAYQTPHELLEAKDTERMLAEALDLLKPRERQLFEMRQMDGLSTDEVATQTGIPKTSIIAMVSAARKKVFTELKKRMKQ